MFVKKIVILTKKRTLHKKKVFLYWKSGTKTIFLKKITKNTE
ncbi:hypothetical protein P783_1054 [Enterococcus faecalis GA2]|nr:hypothetical protein HMPREF0346_2905 [Enterococcus faecalis EnGen0297]KAJ60446.1 hypothetical protein P783_1054 [Enterococcus faecalis GA2]